MKRIIHLDSKDFVSGSSNNQPRLSIDYGFELTGKNTRIKLSGYNIPNSYFQVSATLNNNTFEFEEDDAFGEFTITITSGWYTFSTLISELQTQIAASLATSAAVTVTFNTINGQITFTSDAVTDIALNLAGNPGFAALIGFPATDGVFANTQTSTDSINLTPRRYIYLYSKEIKSMLPLGTLVHVSNNQERMLYKIDTTGDFLDVNILKENISGKYGNLIQGNIPKFLSMECYDAFGNLIDFHGAPWSVDFEIQYC
jgi:hypothetical protein